MVGDTLTLENLISIYSAMSKIKEIDRSNFFNQYFKELEWRISAIETLESIKKDIMI
jgi:hypothetical protein